MGKNRAPASKERQSKIRFFQSSARLVRTWPMQDFELGLTCVETFSLPCVYQVVMLCVFLLLDLEHSIFLEQYFGSGRFPKECFCHNVCLGDKPALLGTIRISCYSGCSASSLNTSLFLQERSWWQCSVNTCCLVE